MVLISFNHFANYLKLFVNRSEKLNNILVYNSIYYVFNRIKNNTKKNMFKNSLKIAINCFEKNDISFLNSLTFDNAYNAIKDFSKKMNFQICKKIKLIDLSQAWGYIDIESNISFKNYIYLILCIPFLPKKINKELQDFFDNKNSLCVLCNSRLDLIECTECYEENNYVYCDFTRKNIKSKCVLHCSAGKNLYHCNGFDVSSDNAEKYFNDYLDKRLVKRINNFNQLNSNNIDTVDINFIKSIVCSNKSMVHSSINYVYSINCDILNIKTSYNKGFLKLDQFELSKILMKEKLNEMLNYLKMSNINWDSECHNVINNNFDEMKNIFSEFLNTLSIDKNIFLTNDEKNNSIKKHRNDFNDCLVSIKEKKDIINMYHIVYNYICNKFLYNTIDAGFNNIDNLIYDIYDQFSLLEKSTPIQNILPSTQVLSSEYENEICSICMDNLNNSKYIVKIDKCIHLFHKSCINQWLQINNSCPVCRII